MVVGELFLSAFLQVLFDRLASRELLQFSCQEGVQSKLNKWKKMLLMIQAVLSDADEKQLMDRAVRMWLDDLQELAYDVEDILDEIATESLWCRLTAEHQTRSNHQVGKLIPAFCKSLSPRAIKFNLSMGSKIKGISSRLKELCKQRFELGLEMTTKKTATAVWKRPPSTCLPTESAVYGRDEDKMKILDMLLRNEPSDANFYVVPIVGMAGVGKTTLARLVYNDKAVEDFKPRAWVCVSDDFDVLRITKAILESITSSPCNLKDLNQVQIQLKDAIAGRKFLIVLDDVWSKNYGLWESLTPPFMAGAPGSKIVVTTRSVDVALTIAPTRYYHLELLSDDDCWSVFVKHAFVDRYSDAHENMKLVRERVVEKCRGLPLAAKALGGLLRCKKRDGEWEQVLNSKIWDLSEESDILPVLRLSYHHLPSHLKRCFAYCAIFPRDYEFEEKELVFLWMAEGLIEQSDDDKQMEDLGSDYFRDLLSRSLFQLSSFSSSKFVMHDLVNDLAQWVSGETIFRLEDESVGNRKLQRMLRARHSSYDSGAFDGKNKFAVFYQVNHLRTFLPIPIGGQDHIRYISNSIVSDLLPKLKKLRVLFLQKYYITELPDSVGSLRHLRYLNLSYSMIRILPESTTSLCNLQILLLRGCYCLKRLPSNFKNLISLRHFDIKHASLIREMPRGMKELTCLQTLSNFIVGKCTGSDVTDLKNLKFLRGELCISRLDNVICSGDTREAILSTKKDLEVLLLEWRSQFDDTRNEIAEESVLEVLQPHRNLKKLSIRCYGGLSFPSWIGDPSLSNMVLLRLEKCERCTSLPSVGLLGSLKELVIIGMRGLKCIGSEIYGAGCLKPFQSLETLCFEDLLELEQWIPVRDNESIQRFPCLRELSIVNCPKLSRRLPDNLPSLEKLVIRKCEQLVVSFSSLALLCKLEVDGCKAMVCNSPIQSKCLNSMTLSNILVFQDWLRQEFEKIEHLKIVGCEQLICLWQNEMCLLKQSEWLQRFTSLRELSIENCTRLVSFPEIFFLSLLSVLKIKNCSALTSLLKGTKNNAASLETLLVEDCHSLPFIAGDQVPSSLKQLSVKNCEKLQYLLHDNGVDNSSSVLNNVMINSISLSLLENLHISHCPNLKCLSSRGWLLMALKHLEIQYCLELTTLLSSSDQLPETLQQLQISSCPKLESIAERFFNNTSLGLIWIGSCRILKYLPEDLHNLTGLQEINIWDCPSLVSFPGGGLPNNILRVSVGRCEKLKALPDHMHSLNTLQGLHICQCPRIISFPETGLSINLTSLSVAYLSNYKPLNEWGLHLMTSLRDLHITGFADVVSFPQDEVGLTLPPSLVTLGIEKFSKLKNLSSKGFLKLTSLEYLSIIDCPNLMSFSEVGLPSSLLQLYISDCPLLKKQCRRDKGQEWSKIAHIPYVLIDSIFIHE